MSDPDQFAERPCAVSLQYRTPRAGELLDGPRHYQEAERHLVQAANHYDRREGLAMQYELGAGIISALLALAAATAIGTNAYAGEAWTGVAGTSPPVATAPSIQRATTTICSAATKSCAGPSAATSRISVGRTRRKVS